MSRIAKLDIADWDAELRTMSAADEATPLERGTLRMMAHCPEISKGFIGFFGAIKANRTLPERLIELVRLRIAFHNQCRSCMAIRYRDAVNEGVTEDLVCSLEKPSEAADLTTAEKAALAYCDLFATNHLAISDATYDGLRLHFSEAQIVELGIFVALCVGFGRLGATWDMVEELPAVFQDKTTGRLAPWSAPPIVVR
jgi:AhpD family alkylhydroperoxidase